MYNFFKRHNLNVDRVFLEYKEVKPGKLYKILNSRGKGSQASADGHLS